MARLRVPRLRWWGWVGVAAGVLVLYLVALSAGRALRADDEPVADRARARAAIAAENWSLVLPAEREELARAVDQAWADLRGYRKTYRSGTPAELAAGTPTVASESLIALDAAGHVASQRDVNTIGARAPGGDGRDQRFEGYRIRTNRAYTNAKGQRIGEAELIYQQAGGVWSCARDIADKRRDPLPALRLAEAGDGGFGEIDGRRVRALQLPAGAFGLRAAATVWVDTETLLIRRQAIDSAVRGQREEWTYADFDRTPAITPPGGITCQDV
jgi:hypothetical protein